MKPCVEYQQALALLALHSLEPGQTAQLRAHLAECQGCREYLLQLSGVAQKLEAIHPPEEVRTSSAFHSKVAAAIRAKASGHSILAQLFNWRIAVPALGMIAVAAQVVLLSQSRNVQVTAPLTAQSAAIPTTDLPPSLAVYRLAMNQSSDQLDTLLTRQANRALLARPPETASTLGGAGLRESAGDEE